MNRVISISPVGGAIKRNNSDDKEWFCEANIDLLATERYNGVLKEHALKLTESSDVLLFIWTLSTFKIEIQIMFFLNLMHLVPIREINK